MSKANKKTKRASEADVEMLAQAAAVWAGFDPQARAEIDLTIAAVAYVAELGAALVDACDALKRGKAPSVTIGKAQRRLYKAAHDFVKGGLYKAKPKAKVARARKVAR